MGQDHVDLLWLPLGAGGRSVRWNGRVFEAVAARAEHRDVRDLYHSALEIHLGTDRHVLEMTPAWGSGTAARGVVAEGPVGVRWLGVSRLFRYEVRCWRDGVIPDVDEAVESPRRISNDPVRARLVLELAPQVPTATWGRDELRAGEMWNSNSIVSWVLARSGHDLSGLGPPAGGRAPGWDAGLAVAGRPLAP